MGGDVKRRRAIIICINFRILTIYYIHGSLIYSNEKESINKALVNIKRTFMVASLEALFLH